MKNSKIKYLILSFLFLLIIITNIISFAGDEEKLRVIFLNIGQGDSILISKGKNQILIDGGKDGKLLLEKLGKYMPFWDRNIESILTTHPDSDHIGGIIDVLENYKVESFIKTNAKSDSATYKKMEEVLLENKSKIIEAKNGITIKMDDEINLKIIYPFNLLEKKVYDDSNAESIVARLDYGINSFLFTGDISSDQDSDLIDKNIEVDFLKVSHHGSKYGTSNIFLDTVKARDAIISVGKNNSYGHPNKELIERLRDHNMNIIRTDEQGDIIYECFDRQSDCFVMKN